MSEAGRLMKQPSEKAPRGVFGKPIPRRDLPKKLGPYVVERPISRGGMAEVYEAKRVGPHGFTKRVAVKRILREHASREDFVAMFIDEARLAAGLQHPNIVQVFDFGDAAGDLYLAMELVEGSNVNQLLRELAARGETVPLEAALHLVSQAARALAYAHDARDEQGQALGLVHRDVSPANLLITHTGHLKLSDFGIARAAFTARNTEAGQLRGKLGYMSPEQVLGERLTDRSDIFTLSTVFAEMLLGETLFSRGNDVDVLVRIRDADLSVLHGTSRRIPHDVRELLNRGLSARPEERPSASAFAGSVEQILTRRGVAAHGPSLVARLLQRLELCHRAVADAQASEAGARPTSLVDMDDHLSPTLVQPDRLVGQLGLEDSGSEYKVRTAEGVVHGPLKFPELVALVTSGAMTADSPVKCGSRDWRPATQLPELARFFATPALQWHPEETSNACFSGEFRTGTLVRVLHELMARHETGMLHLDVDEVKKKIYFVDGRPEFVASTDPNELLGRYLIDTGRCLPMEVNMGLAMLPTHGGRLGDALVNIGALRPLQLYQAIAAQVRDRYLGAYRWQHGRWAFVRGARSHEDTYPFETEHHTLTRDGLMLLDPNEVESALAPMWEQVVAPVTAPAVSVNGFRMPDDWEYVLRMARGNSTVGGVFARATSQQAIDPEAALRALYLGVSCGLLETRAL